MKVHHLTLDDWSKLVQIAAIIVGGVAAYVKWFRGRLYRPRLELTVTGSLIGETQAKLLVIARVKNLGLSNVHIDQKGTGLSEMKLQGPSQMLGAEWKPEATFSVYQRAPMD